MLPCLKTAFYSLDWRAGVQSANSGIIPYADADRELKELVPDFPLVNCGGIEPIILLLLLD